MFQKGGLPTVTVQYPSPGPRAGPARASECRGKLADGAATDRDDDTGRDSDPSCASQTRPGPAGRRTVTESQPPGAAA
eukprot:745973-Hanusia_phi.AAC.1